MNTQLDDEIIAYVEDTMKRFKLIDMKDQYLDVISEAEKDKLCYFDFLLKLLQIEDEGKTKRRQIHLINKANFDKLSRLDEIDYSFNHSLNKDKIEELGTLRFLKAKENIIIIGPPGVGKSMIATGIGLNACNAGYKVLFVNAKELVDNLYKAMQNGVLAETLRKINKIQLLIIDELSYIKMDKERESLFFQLIRQRYEKNSLIITTNLPMGKWDELFTGQLAATAILDRLLHHCHIMSITGDSYRVKGSNFSKKQKGI